MRDNLSISNFQQIKRIIKIRFLLLFFWLFLLSLPQLTADPKLESEPIQLAKILKVKKEKSKTPPHLIEFQKELDKILSVPQLKNAQVGAAVLSLKPDGDFIYEKNADKLLIPASCMKLFTTGAALVILGPDFQYTTSVYRKGKIDEFGTLQGDLIIKGSGDPSISDRYGKKKVTAVLEEFAQKVKEAGIKKITGNIIGDATYFDNEEVNWGWNLSYLDRWYAARVSALSFNDNCVNIYVYPGNKIGDKAKIVLDPETSYVTVVNRTITGKPGSENTIGFQREYNSPIIYLRGNIPINYKNKAVLWVAIDKPALYTATVFKEILIQQGIEVLGDAKEVQQPDQSPVTSDAVLLATYTSPPLSTLIKTVNKASHNFFADQILKTIGAVKYNEGSFDAGARAVKEFLEKEVKVDVTGFRQVDGSGLSRYNQVTPLQIVKLLDYLFHHKYSNVFYDSLSIPKVDGTLKNRLTKLSSRLRGKTGYLGMVSALSGYLTTKSGEPLAFSIIVNNYSTSYSTVLQIENKFVEKLVEYHGEPGEPEEKK